MLHKMVYRNTSIFVVLFLSIITFSAYPGASHASDIAAAEYFFDSDPGEGFGIALSAADGAFDSSEESVDLSNIATSSLMIGHHTLYVRFKDADGMWEVARPIAHDPDFVSPFNFRITGEKWIAGAEYFIDIDPGEGNGTPVGAIDGVFDDPEEELGLSGIDISHLGAGPHTLYVRVQNNEGTWGIVRQVTFEIYEPASIAGAEYFIDEDPGKGNGTALYARDGRFDSEEEDVEAFNINTTGLECGYHTLSVRFKDSLGHWSSPSFVEFNILSGEDDADNDGMPDGWEFDNGLDPSVNDAFDHKDEDGFCNWREYLAGTDPNDPTDIPGNIDIYVDDDNTSGIEDGTKENPFNTAQEGVKFSGPGDDVYVAAGAYVENVLIERSISLIGDGADVTIIDGSGSAQPAVCCMALDGGSIEGFRIQNGTHAGIQCEQSSLSIRENIISNTSSGHGIKIDTGSSVTIENNIIYDNDLHGIDFQGVAATIMNNTIVSNKDDGIGCTSGDGVMIKNNIIVSNEDHGISCDQSPEPPIFYNNVWNNTVGDYFGCSPGTGDITGNPLFEDSVIYDFHIRSGSPCIDAGTSDGAPEFDFDGNGRYDDPNTEPNTGGGTYTYYDMGAYEYFSVCKGDFDKDGDVDGSDLAVFADAFGSSSGGPGYNPVADFDGDGYVDESDLAAFAAEFGRTDCPICP